MKKNVLAFAIASAFPFVCINEARAAAFALAEQGVSGLGNAYAGAAAVAEDASTVWWNPAGMSRLARGKHLLLGGHVIVPSTKFNDDASQAAALQTTNNGDGGDAGGTALVPNLFYAMDLNPAWSFGIGVNVPFGLATEYSRDWIGRFQGINSEVKTLNINPSVSYKLSDRASLGFGVSYQRGAVDLETAVNIAALAGGALGANVEARNKVSVDGDAWGFNAGALFDVGPATRVGVHYRSSLDYNLDGTTRFSNVHPAVAADPRVANGDVKLDIETPATLSFSAAHRVNDRLELLGDVTWTEWSKIKELMIVRSNGTTLDTLTFDFDDTWRISAGANYKWAAPWTLKVGVAYDQSPVPNAEVRSVRLPDNDRYWLAFGASYQMSRSSRLDAGYAYVHVKDAKINNDQRTVGRGLVNGTYEANVHILSLQYQHSF